MPQVIRPSTVLPARRTPFTVRTDDGVDLVGEIARPEGEVHGSILCLHPLPTAGGMMDSHVFKKAANRLPAMAGINVVRFNTRGTESEQGKSGGAFDGGGAEGFDVAAMMRYCIDELALPNLWIVGWSFGTDLALRHARDPRHRGLILLSPPLRWTDQSDLEFWAKDGRPVIGLIPEFDDYLRPVEAREKFASLPQFTLIAVEDAKHLWVGEPAVHRILTEIVRAVAPSQLPLPLEW